MCIGDTLFGDSGSGVFDIEGNLVGVVFAINSSGFVFDVAHGLCIDSQDVIDFVQTTLSEF